MKKVLAIIATLVALCAIIITVLFFQLNNLIKVAVQRYGSEITGVSVSLGFAEISPMSGEGALNDFVIANPEGFKHETAFKAARISLKVDKASLKTDTIIIQEMSIDAPHIDYELAGTSNNFAVIQAHIKKKLADSSMANAESDFDDKTIIINDLYIKNGSITVSAPIIAGQTYHVVLPDIHLQQLGKGDKPGNLPKIMQRIMMILTGDVMSAVGPVTLKNFDKMVTEGGVINPINDVQKAAQGLVKDIGM